MMNKIKKTIVLDGTKIQLAAYDLDGDGKTGGIETITPTRDNGIVPISQPTELGDALSELNRDEIENNTRMTGMDMRARLIYTEEPYILAMDTLVAFRVCPTRCLSFTRQKKRISVSRDGKGRQEIVDIVAGKKEQDQKAGLLGFGDRFKNFMGFKGDNNNG